MKLDKGQPERYELEVPNPLVSRLMLVFTAGKDVRIGLPESGIRMTYSETAAGSSSHAIACQYLPVQSESDPVDDS